MNILKSLSTVVTAKWVLAIFLCAQPLILYSLYYDPHDCDDKAVHAFSSAAMFRQNQNALQISPYIQSWSDQLATDALKQRMQNRLESVWNYPVSSSLLFFAIGSLPDNSAFIRINESIKYVFAGMFLFAFFYLLIMMRKLTGSFWEILFAINLLMFRLPSFWIDPELMRLYGPLAYVPRGSAVFFLPVLITAYATGAYRIAILTAVLLLGWHVGFGAAILGVLFLSIPVFYFLNQYASQLTKDPFQRICNATVSVLIVCCLAIILFKISWISQSITAVTHNHLVGEIPVRLLGPAGLLGWWLVILYFKTPIRLFIQKFSDPEKLFMCVISCCIVFVVLWFFYPYKYRHFFTGQISILKTGCCDVAENRTGITDPVRLDPNQEPVFFYSLMRIIQ